MENFILTILAVPGILTCFVVLLSFVTKNTNKAKWWRTQIFVAYDQLLNSLFKGWADETISSRMYRKSLEIPCLKCATPKELIDRIFFLSPNHCEKSYYSEKERMQMPPSLRGEE